MAEDLCPHLLLTEYAMCCTLDDKNYECDFQTIYSIIAKKADGSYTMRPVCTRYSQVMKNVLVDAKDNKKLLTL